MDEKGNWSDIPRELLPIIGNCLESRIDILRFRSVCESWRSSLSLPLPNSPSFPPKIPFLLRRYFGDTPIEVNLIQSTFYRIEPPQENPNSEPSSSPSSSKGWLIKVEESESRPKRLFNPVSNRQIVNPPRLWNLSDYRVLELFKAYDLHHGPRGFSFKAVNKVVFLTNPSRTNVGDSVICIINDGTLEFMKYGDENWTLVDDRNFHYDDVIVYKGHLYVVERRGTISWINFSSLKLIQYSPPLGGSGNKKNLVESCGSLYVVDRYYEGQPRRGSNIVEPDHDVEVVDFKVFKLDEEWGTWVDVKSLGDRVFILGGNCSFSVSAKEYAGFQGDCIFFFDFSDVRMYNLNDGSIVKVGGRHPTCGYSSLFWPPPSWLRV